MADLVPYKNNLLSPQDAREITTAVALPGVFHYSGSIAVALTENAIWLVAPNHEHIMIAFPNVRRVRTEQFSGIAYLDYVDGEQTVVAPNDAAGVTIEYRTYGELTNQVSFLCFFATKAHMWAQKIQEAVNAKNRQMYLDDK